MSFYDDLKEGLTYLVDTGADIYKEQLKQETEQDRIETTNKVTEQLAGDSFMIGETTFSIKKNAADTRRCSRDDFNFKEREIRWQWQRERAAA